MRIGVVTHSYYPRYGGVSEHVAALARHMRTRGHDVTIITGHYPNEGPREAGVYRLSRTYLVPHNGAFCDLTLSADLPFALKRVLDRADFDVLHVHEPYAPVLGLLAVRLARCPVVGTFHACAPKNNGYAMFARALRVHARRLSARIAVSSAARALVERYVPGDYEIVPNGVETARFHPDVAPHASLRGDAPTVLFVGRLDPRKGVHVLLDAMVRVRRAVPEARLVVAGHGPLAASLRRHARALPAGVVRFTGAVDAAQLPHYYAAADVVVSPALGNESFGIVLLEAMSSGRALVASDIDGYRSVVTHGRDGLLTPPGDAPTLAHAIEAALSDPGLRARLAREGRRTALRYDWRAVTDRVEHVYARVAGETVAEHAVAVPAVGAISSSLS